MSFAHEIEYEPMVLTIFTYKLSITIGKSHEAKEAVRHGTLSEGSEMYCTRKVTSGAVWHKVVHWCG
jgi:hypothetical protein